jgi:hypothetical protein
MADENKDKKAMSGSASEETDYMVLLHGEDGGDKSAAAGGKRAAAGGGAKSEAEIGRAHV